MDLHLIRRISTGLSVWSINCEGCRLQTDHSTTMLDSASVDPRTRIWHSPP